MLAIPSPLASVKTNILKFLQQGYLSSLLRKLCDPQFIRFLLVGGLNTLFGFSVFSAIVYFGGQTWHALLGGNLAGIAFNFFTIGGVVFRDLGFRRIPRFLVAYLGLFAINYQCIHLLTSIYTLGVTVAQAFLAPPLAILSYLIMSKFVFPGIGKVGARVYSNRSDES
jgi:putative flippase GtrA